jgi:dimethylaniline monooxygenase (N-oxide forming)
LFFTAGAIGLHGNKTFNKALHGGEDLQAHRASITSMSGNTVSLSNGDTVPADAAIFGSGWDFRSTSFNPADALELGTNSLLKDEDAAASAYWKKLQAYAEKEVLETLPILKAPPPHHELDVEYTPLRLYHCILSLSLVEKSDRSLIFLGLVTNTQTSIYAKVSGLWGVSWMESLLDISKSKEELDSEIAKVNAWMARRYFSRRRTRQVASAEIQDVTDVLMRDMGLKVYRKSNWISEIFAPLRAQDYKGIVQGMLDKSGK